MMSQHSRRKLPRGNTRKGKHGAAEADNPASREAADLTATVSNGLLAGYLAHEFLTKGTVMGRKFEDGLGGSSSGEAKRSKVKLEGVEPTQSARKEQDGYVEVTTILKNDGTHIKGVVNPTQLSNWINQS